MNISEGANRETPDLFRYDPVDSFEVRRRYTYNDTTYVESNWRGLFISEYGDVISFRRCRNTIDYDIKPKVMTPKLSIAGYKMISISIRTNNVAKTHWLFVHRLVAETFLGIKPKNYVVDHKDENRLNNHVTNLQYIKQGDNISKNRKTLTNYVKPDKVAVDAIVDGKLYNFDSTRLFYRHFDLTDSKLRVMVKNFKANKIPTKAKFKIVNFKRSQETIEIELQTIQRVE